MSKIVEALRVQGLLLRGGFLLDPETDQALLGRFPDARQLLLVGNAGSAIWPHLKRFLTANPAVPDPLDHWTSRVLGEIAGRFDAMALFPFGGAPWWPFQQWARRADTVSPSPLAILIHPTYGLWHAYRGVLLLRSAVALPPPPPPTTSPCDSCSDKPCLHSCPVAAFSPAGYDVEGCARHVNSTAGLECQTRGCLARLACPVGQQYRYESEHAVFHMAAFQRSHPTRAG
ncbi:MAG TPA: hypothetical protein VND94_12425 [Terriglobia bacterium]|nr:hypothetical protein [Terriglobia bacterium]